MTTTISALSTSHFESFNSLQGFVNMRDCFLSKWNPRRLGLTKPTHQRDHQNSANSASQYSTWHTARGMSGRLTQNDASAVDAMLHAEIVPS